MHEPVLKDEIIKFLDPQPGHIVLDNTIGSGGHAEAILERILPNGILFGIDQDEEAIARAQERLSRFGDSVKFIEVNFRNLDEVFLKFPLIKFDSILFDLGFSQDQVFSPKRGFSFRIDAPLDMRMSLKLPHTAADLINTCSDEQLADIFWKFGEEHQSRRIAKKIIEARKINPIKTTVELAEIIRQASGRKYGRIHPATKVFQALRIAVNDELGALEEALPKALDALKAGGRMAIISFHSLEDRMVKNFFRVKEKEGMIRVLNRKVVIPSREECIRNPRARSAKLRVAEKG